MRYEFRSAEGRTCCRTDNVKNLCPTCSRRVGAAAVPVPAPVSGAAARQDFAPPPPSLAAAIQALRNGDVTETAPSTTGAVPPPPSLGAYIRAFRRTWSPSTNV
jgi:hypothetical protein